MLEGPRPILIEQLRFALDVAGDNVVVTIVNLDPVYRQSGWVTLDLTALGLTGHETYEAHDLLTGNRHLWQGARNYVELTPSVAPAHILRVRGGLQTERDFDPPR